MNEVQTEGFCMPLSTPVSLVIDQYSTEQSTLLSSLQSFSGAHPERRHWVLITLDIISVDTILVTAILGTCHQWLVGQRSDTKFNLSPNSVKALSNVRSFKKSIRSIQKSYCTGTLQTLDNHWTDLVLLLMPLDTYWTVL